jgi:hypothetical protein
MSNRTAPLLALLLLLACGSDAVTDPPAGSTSSSSGSTSEAKPGDDAAAADDECTTRGALYECHPTPACNPDFMPLASVSCGAHGGTCCVRGALPPTDASTDG